MFPPIAFLDAYAHHRSRDGRRFFKTINWDDWQEVGITVRAQKQFAETYGIQDQILDPLDSFSPAEGVDLFRRLLD